MKDEEENKLVNVIIDLQQSMEKKFAKVNAGLHEMRTSYMQLDESFNRMSSDFNKYAQRNDDKVTNHETRIMRLEDKTLGSAFVAEPKVHYGKRKKK